MMPTPSTNPSAPPRSIRLRRVIKALAFAGIALAVVMLIPAAPGQSGGGGGGAGRAIPGVSSTPLPWRPFIDPIDIHSHWYWLLIPMALGISVVYKAIRLQTLDRYWFQVLNMTVQIVVAMIMLGAASAFIVLKFAPFILSR